MRPGERRRGQRRQEKGDRRQEKGDDATRTFWNVMGPSRRRETNTVQTERRRIPKSRLYNISRSLPRSNTRRPCAALLPQSADGIRLIKFNLLKQRIKEMRL